VESSLTTIPYVYAKVPYDVEKDLAPISQVVTVPHLLVAHPSLPVRSVRDLIALAKSRSGAINYAAGSAGSNPHLAMEVFAHTAGIKMVHVPFKGQGPALTDVLGGHTSLMMANVLSALPHTKAGRLRALGVSSAKRAAVAPQVPTIAEPGYKGFEAVTWFGIAGPAHLPKDIVAKLNADINKALQSPEVQKKLGDQGADVAGSTPEQFAKLIHDDIARWGKIVKESGAKVD